MTDDNPKNNSAFEMFPAQNIQVWLALIVETKYLFDIANNTDAGKYQMNINY